MRSPYTRRQVLAVGSAITVASLAGCQTLLAPGTENASDSLSLAYSESTASVPSDEETHSGWVHIVSDGDSADLTFDIRFCRALGGVEPELVHSTTSEFVLRFNVDSDVPSKTPSGTETDTGCTAVTHLVCVANAPSDWGTLRIVAGDAELQVIERSGTMPELRPLPDPVGAR